MSKKILSVLLTLCMLLGMFPVVLPVSAAEEDALPEVDLVQYTEIADADALAALMADNTAWGGNYKLTADIDLTGKTQSPIGTEDVPFTGIFDGNSKTISGLSIAGTAGYQGLFGKIDGATVKNLTVSGSVGTTAGDYVSGIVAYAAGAFTVENCVNNVNVKNTGAKIGGASGGVVGTVELSAAGETAVVKNCVNNGTVDTEWRYCGGVVGYVKGSVAQDLEISGCKNYGAVTLGGNVAGGILGYYIGTPAAECSLTVKDSANYATITAAGYVGGAVGAILGTVNKYPVNVNLYNLYNAGNVVGPLASTGSVVGYIRPPKAIDGVIPINFHDCINVGPYTASGIFGCPATPSATTAITLYNLYNATGAYIVGTNATVNGTATVNKEVITLTGNCNNESLGSELADLAANDLWVGSTLGADLASFHDHKSDKFAADGENGHYAISLP